MSTGGIIFMAAEDLEEGQTVVICDKVLTMVYRGTSHKAWSKNKLSTFVVGVTLKAAKTSELVPVDVGNALSAEQLRKPLDSAEVELYRMMFQVEKGSGNGST
jgi:hypothetical protein